MVNWVLESVLSLSTVMQGEMFTNGGYCKKPQYLLRYVGLTCTKKF